MIVKLKGQRSNTNISVDVGPSPHWSDDCIGGKREQYK